MNPDDQLATHSALKTEDGQRFPAAAFAFVPDADKPSTWKVRIWESLEKQTTRRQLGRATSAFSPGGFRGERVRLPMEEISRVKARVRAAYQKIGVSRGTIPRWIQEANDMSRLHAGSHIAIEEKAFDKAKGEIEVAIIRPGFNLAKTRFYPQEVLARDAHIFEGARMFKDHATVAEDRAKPEGSVDRYVGDLGKPWVEADGTLKASAKVHDPTFREKLANMSEAGTLPKMGISIRALGEGVKATVEGMSTVLVERLLRSQSVDFVTTAGAGGQVDLFESAEAEAEDLEVIDEAQLRKARPDLVELIESAAAESAADAVRQKGNGTMSEIEELHKQVATLTASAKQDAKNLKEAKDAKKESDDKLQEAQRETAKGKTATAVTEALSNAKDLPEPAKKRISAQFAEADSADGIQAAIDAEKAYLKEVAPKKVSGFGDSKEGDQEGDGHKVLVESLTESYQDAGHDKDEAKRLAEIAAR